MLRSVALLMGATALTGLQQAADDDRLTGLNTECPRWMISAGLCDGGGGDGIDIWDEIPGGPPAVPAPPPAPGPPPDPGGPGGPPPEAGPGEPGRPENPGDDGGGWWCLGPNEELYDQCLQPGEPEEEPGEEQPIEAPRPVEIPEIWHYDVASFAPAPSQPVIEPHGVAIARAPMNVAVGVAAQTVGGELFGQPMSVTFTPAHLTIDYGDGTVRDIAEGAHTWADLGQQQLTPTATSHTYAERGQATVTVDVAYTAAVDFGPYGVHPVRGFVVSQGDGVPVQILEKQSYLVEHTCAEDPTAPGC